MSCWGKKKTFATFKSSSEHEIWISLKYCPKLQIVHSSKLIDFADDNFIFIENSRKFIQRVENIVGKGEIACYRQFLLFPQCFQRLKLQTSKPGLVWERIKSRDYVDLAE